MLSDPSSPPPEGSLIGRTIGRFRVLSKLGQGGMGVVYLARDEDLRRNLALKVLPPSYTGDPERRRRFLREARSAAAVTHPCIASIFEVGEADGLVFIAMELVEGKSLREILARGPLPVERAHRLARQIARGLAKAHDKGIVHRDLKPDNVMLDGEEQVKILDFGLAKGVGLDPSAAADDLAAGDTESVMTVEGGVLGTPGYMSPEQARGRRVDARSDLFSFGVMLYEMVAGVRPFRGDSTVDLLVAITRDEPEPLSAHCPEGAPALEAVILEVSAQVPEDWYAGARELLEALDRIAPSSGGSPPLGTAPSPWRRARDDAAASAATATAGTLTPAALAEAPLAEPSGTSSQGARSPASRPRVSSVRARRRLLGAAAALAALACAGGVASFRAWRGHASPLASPTAILGCPPLEASGVEPPAGWLGAAAASVACRRAGWYLGGRRARTLLPAELLDLPTQPSSAIPADVYGQPGARARGVEAARARAAAWLDGEVTQRTRDFRVTLIVRGEGGREIARGAGEDRLLYRAVGAALAPLLAQGAIPHAKAIDPDVAPWAGTTAPEAAAALEDFNLSTLDLPSAAECERLEKHRAAFGAGFEALRAACEEVHRGSPEGIAVPPLDHGSAPAFAWAAASAVRYGKGDPTKLADEAHRLAEQAQTPFARAQLEVVEAGLAFTAGDAPRARLAALRATRDDPYDVAAWQYVAAASFRQPGGDLAMRAQNTWAPDYPDAWNGDASSEPSGDTAVRVRLERRAVILDPDFSLYSVTLGDYLLESGQREEVRGLAANLSAGGPFQRRGADLLLAEIDASEAHLGAALSRALRTLEETPLLGGLETCTMGLVGFALHLALVLGKEAEVSDRLAQRFVLAEPPRLDAWSDYSSRQAAYLCLFASRSQAIACVTRLRKLLDSGFFRAGHTGNTLPFIDGTEKFAWGDHAGAVASFRPILANARQTFLLAAALDKAGDDELATRLDAAALKQRGPFNGVSLAEVREARRAQKRGDLARAKELAKTVVEALGVADAEAPVAVEMRALLGR